MMIATPLNELLTASVSVSLVNCICSIPCIQRCSGGDLLTRRDSVLPSKWQKDQGDFRPLAGVQLCWLKLIHSVKNESSVAHKNNFSRENFWPLKQAKLWQDFLKGRHSFPSAGLHPTSNYPSLNAFTLPVYLTSFRVKIFLVKCQKMKGILHHSVTVC